MCALVFVHLDLAAPYYQLISGSAVATLLLLLEVMLAAEHGPGTGDMLSSPPTQQSGSALTSSVIAEVGFFLSWGYMVMRLKHHTKKLLRLLPFSCDLYCGCLLSKILKFCPRNLLALLFSSLK